jgi:hypothetical protein
MLLFKVLTISQTEMLWESVLGKRNLGIIILKILCLHHKDILIPCHESLPLVLI